MGGGGGIGGGAVYIPSNVAAAVRKVVTDRGAGGAYSVTSMTSLQTEEWCPADQPAATGGLQ